MDQINKFLLNPPSRKVWIILRPSLMVLMVCALAYGQESSQTQPQLPPNAQPGGDLISHLNLSPEQLEKIKAIGAEQRVERQNAARRIKDAERLLDDAIYVDNADESVITARAKEVADARAEMVRLQAIREARIRRILTAEQLATFLELRRQFRQNLRQRRWERSAPNANKQGFRPADSVGPKKFDRGANRVLNPGAASNSNDAGQNRNIGVSEPVPPNQ
jgi:Spy/CpxP family protein refolding chaperone